MDSVRDLFPITKQRFPIMGGIEEKPLIYFDHGASTHPPAPVIETHKKFLEKYYANIHRGNHNLSLIATDMFDKVEETILDFIGGDHTTNTAILTANTTGALDLAAYIMSVYEGITLTTTMEHHSNYLPHKHRGTTVLVDINPDGSLNMEDLKEKLNDLPIKLVAVTGASNVTGFMPDIHEIARLAHDAGARILVDGAQLLAHHKVDVRPDDDPCHIDFFAAAGHKAYAPFGSAFLFGPRELFDRVDPYIPGGGTVQFVTPRMQVWAKSPDRHQGGTPNIPGAIAMAEALKFLRNIGLDKIREHEKELYVYALKKLQAIEGVTIYGPKDPEKCIGVISFNIADIPNELAAAILNYEAAIATRNGCFCAHPYIQSLMDVKDPEGCWEKYERGETTFLMGAIRVTLGIYNTLEEIDALAEMVQVIRNKEWKGEYDLLGSSLCQPIRFAMKETSCPGATCLKKIEADTKEKTSNNSSCG
jgi:selenocysteine lyase/cysteine desulfurase